MAFLKKKGLGASAHHNSPEAAEGYFTGDRGGGNDER